MGYVPPSIPYRTYTSDSTADSDYYIDDSTGGHIEYDFGEPVPGEFGDLDEDIMKRAIEIAKREQKDRELPKRKLRRKLTL